MALTVSAGRRGQGTTSVSYTHLDVYKRQVIIMFITNMIQYAVRGYEVDAMDYVVKPVEYFAFSQKLDKAIGRMKKAVQTYISVSYTHLIRLIVGGL